MAIPVVAPKLCHQAGDHHAQVGKCWSASQNTGGLVKENSLLRVEE